MSEPHRDWPFDDLRRALQRVPDDSAGPLDQKSRVRVDPNRRRRTGIPEVVHAESKPAADVAGALRGLVEANGRALASRVPAASVAEIRSSLESDFVVEEHPVARALVASCPGCQRQVQGGRVGVLSAGSSDVPVAMEAALMAEEMGVCVLTAWDVGVAGLHRLVEPLEWFVAEDVDAIIVAAGMDGALPSVVAGLVNIPVIGLPIAVGYGLGAGGIGALTTMLQSCAPGLVVVNIDNGIGAGATAALIANRAAMGRPSGAS
jgi:pyridinium-3,5-biscarboxylic acid mononucleotide synthase